MCNHRGQKELSDDWGEAEYQPGHDQWTDALAGVELAKEVERGDW